MLTNHKFIDAPLYIKFAFGCFALLAIIFYLYAQYQVFVNNSMVYCFIGACVSMGFPAIWYKSYLKYLRYLNHLYIKD